MKRFTTFLLMLLLASRTFAQIPSGYYDSAQGKDSVDLLVALYNIIKGHTSVSYSSLHTHYQSTDKKANGKVWDMYSDIPGGTPPYEYNFTSADQCGNYSGEGDCYNREHSFPQSYFNSASPMQSDLFHLYPTDGWVNGKRSNYPYGEVGTASWTSQNGSKLGTCSATGYSGTVFEPIDAYKGDFARTYFYMAARYNNVIGSWENNDSQGNSDAILDGTSFPVYETWFLDLMHQWHLQDSVSAKEIARNEAIYLIQNNRNPFIDHPEWVDSVWYVVHGGGSGVGLLEVKTPSLNIYPNPVDDKLQINISNASFGLVQIKIIDLQGKEILSQQFENKEIIMNTTNLNPGVYLLIVDGDNGKFLFNSKLVK